MLLKLAPGTQRMSLQSPEQESSVVQPWPCLTHFQAEEETGTSPWPHSPAEFTVCIFLKRLPCRESLHSTSVIICGQVFHRVSKLAKQGKPLLFSPREETGGQRGRRGHASLLPQGTCSYPAAGDHGRSHRCWLSEALLEKYWLKSTFTEKKTNKWSCSQPAREGCHALACLSAAVSSLLPLTLLTTLILS